jgi:hypothetical protein
MTHAKVARSKRLYPNTFGDSRARADSPAGPIDRSPVAVLRRNNTDIRLSSKRHHAALDPAPARITGNRRRRGSRRCASRMQKGAKPRFRALQIR